MKIVCITPQARKIIDNVEIVTIPGSEGDFTVLRRHAPLISAVNKGVLRYDDNKIPIERGVVEVKDDVITIITEQ